MTSAADTESSGITIRRASSGDYPRISKMLQHAFGEPPNQTEFDIYAEAFEPERCFVAEDDGELIGSTAATSAELTVPGPVLVEAASLMWAGVLPTHRRRGTLRRLMAAQLAEIAGRRQAIVLLHASEGGIYGRFGFAPGTRFLGFTADTARARVRSLPIEDTGRVRFLDREEATELLPGVYDRLRKLRSGQVARRPYHWRELLHEVDEEREGAGLFFVVHMPANHYDTRALDGYAIYWVEERWERHAARNRVHLRELVAEAGTARRRLWNHVLSLDLVESVRTETAPADEPLWWMLSDPRALQIDLLVDGMYVRILDVPAALEARTYDQEGSVVFEVLDESLPDAGGTFRLDIRGGRGICARSSGESELVLDERALAAVYLGGEDLTALAAAGLARELRAGALRRAGRLFRSAPTPWTATIF